jgi:hypothetical protein
LILLATALSTLLAALLSALTGLLSLLTRILLLAALLTTLILLVHRLLLFGSDNVQRVSVMYGSIVCRRANTLRRNLDRVSALIFGPSNNRVDRERI